MFNPQISDFLLDAHKFQEFFSGPSRSHENPVGANFDIFWYGFVWKSCTPLYPIVLLIIIPFLNGYFIGNINPTFSDIPILILPKSAHFFSIRMYLLQKYDALSGLDHAEFISKDVPPWHISHDTCGPQVEPPAARSQVKVVFFFGKRVGTYPGKNTEKSGRSSVSERITRRCNHDPGFFLGRWLLALGNGKQNI